MFPFFSKFQGPEAASVYNEGYLRNLFEEGRRHCVAELAYAVVEKRSEEDL